MSQFQQRRHPPASVPPDHPAASLPRRRLAVLRPGMVVDGVITRMVRGGVLVDIQLESGEPAFVPLSEIPAKAMPRVRQLQEQAAMQAMRIVQVDRANGTATASLHGMLKGLPEADGGAPVERRPAPAVAQAPVAPAPAPEPARKLTASERARKQQEEILRRMRGDA